MIIKARSDSYHIKYISYNPIKYDVRSSIGAMSKKKFLITKSL